MPSVRSRLDPVFEQTFAAALPAPRATVADWAPGVFCFVFTLLGLGAIALGAAALALAIVHPAGLSARVSSGHADHAAARAVFRAALGAPGGLWGVGALFFVLALACLAAFVVSLSFKGVLASRENAPNGPVPSHLEMLLADARLVWLTVSFAPAAFWILILNLFFVLPASLADKAISRDFFVAALHRAFFWITDTMPKRLPLEWSWRDVRRAAFVSEREGWRLACRRLRQGRDLEALAIWRANRFNPLWLCPTRAEAPNQTPLPFPLVLGIGAISRQLASAAPGGVAPLQPADLDSTLDLLRSECERRILQNTLGARQPPSSATGESPDPQALEATSRRPRRI
jgi:hypothetical protein